MAGVAALNRQKGLSAEDIQILCQASAIMTDNRLCDLFGPDALAEAALSGKAAGPVQGQVDRPVVKDAKVSRQISNQAHHLQTRKICLRDMSAKWLYMQKFFARFILLQITCWVIWTQTAEVSMISDAQLHEVLSGLVAYD